MTAAPVEPVIVDDAGVERAEARSRRRPYVRALASIAALAVAAAGTWALTRAGEPSLGIFDRAPTSEEVAKATELRSTGFVQAGEDVSARLLLEAPTRRSATGQRVWAYLGESALFGGPGASEFVCLALEAGSAAGSQGSILGCMRADDMARRGFVPLDGPRPFLFIDNERRLIEWGPTGPARLVDPLPPLSTPAPQQPSDATERGGD